MCSVEQFLVTQKDACRESLRKATTGAEAIEWAQIALMLSRERSAHFGRCKECQSKPAEQPDNAARRLLVGGE